MFWIFAFIFCIVLAFLISADIKYYYNHFKGDKHDRRDKPK